MNFYTFKTLQEYLRKGKLPASRPTLLEYEKKKVIKKPENTLYMREKSYSDRLSPESVRIYTLPEILEIVEIIGDLKSYAKKDKKSQ